MYGTIARLRVKPGKEQELERFGRESTTQNVPGMVFDYIFRTDANPQELFLVAGFESKEAYRANAESPEQHARYEEYRALLDADPEWHDGEIIFSYPE
jgi:quinol monooxygenase YgiN